MFDTEAKRVFDKLVAKEDLQELQREENVDAHPGKLTEDLVEEFYAVVSSMETALGEQPSDQFSDELSPSLKYALNALWMANTASDSETGEFISGAQRSNLLNQALMYLQPILALGLRLDFKEGRKLYDSLVPKVTQVRGKIKSAIAVQLVPPQKAKPRDKKSDDDGDTPVPPDDSDDSIQDSAASDQLDGRAEDPGDSSEAKDREAARRDGDGVEK